jgi:hypothetical protein
MLSLLPCASIMANSQTIVPRRQVTLDSLRENSRPLLIFSPRATDSRVLRQFELLAGHAGGLHERQVPPILIPAINLSRPPACALDIFTVSSEEAAGVRKRFHVAQNAFTVILLGKDGGEKLRSDYPLSYEKLRETIDAMPMRQDEMRHQR